MKNFFSDQAVKLFGNALGKSSSDRSAASSLAWQSRPRAEGSSVSTVRDVPAFVPSGHEKTHRKLFSAGVAPSSSKAGASDHLEPSDILNDDSAFRDLEVLPEDKVAYYEVMDMGEPEQKAMLKELGLADDEALAQIKAAMRTNLRESSTRKAHLTAENVFTDERTALHHEIADAIVAKGTIAPPGTKPEMLLTGGLPGSGKSTMLKNPAFGDVNRFTKFDSDAIKQSLFEADCKARLKTDACPEKLGARAASYHEETDAVRDLIIKKAIDEKRNFLFDGTLKTKASAEKMINKFKAKGYEVKMAFADLPLKKAMGRAINRFLDPKDEGRFVDPAYIASHDRANIATFEALKSSVSEWHHFNTDVPKGRLAVLNDSHKNPSSEKSLEFGLDLYKKRRIDPTGRRSTAKPKAESGGWWAFDDGEDRHLQHTLDYLDEIFPDGVERGQEPTLSINKADEVQSCVSAKIPILIREGYEQEQAVAIAHSMCQKDPSAHEKDTESSRLAWESRQRAASKAPASDIDSALGGLKYGDKANLPGLKWGETTVQGFTATYVGDKKGNRTYRILDNEKRFVWNLSHKRLVSALETKDLKGEVDMEKFGEPAKQVALSDVMFPAWSKAQRLAPPDSVLTARSAKPLHSQTEKAADRSEASRLAWESRKHAAPVDPSERAGREGESRNRAFHHINEAMRHGNVHGREHPTSQQAKEALGHLEQAHRHLDEAHSRATGNEAHANSYDVAREAVVRAKEKLRQGKAPTDLHEAHGLLSDIDPEAGRKPERPMAPIRGGDSEEGDAERAKVVQMQQGQKLVSILTQEDQRRQKREPNIYRLGLFLEAYDRAKANSKGIAEGLRTEFEESPLLDRMLRAVEPKAK